MVHAGAMLTLHQIIAGILAYCPGASVEWNVMSNDGGWTFVVRRNGRTLVSAADTTGLRAAARALGRLWSNPARTRGRRA